MLNIWFGKDKEHLDMAIENIFNEIFEISWFEHPVAKEFLHDLGAGEVVKAKLETEIDGVKEIVGVIREGKQVEFTDFNRGLKLLFMMLFHPENRYFASLVSVSPKYEEWIYKISQIHDLKIVCVDMFKIPEPFQIYIENTDEYITTSKEMFDRWITAMDTKLE